MLRLNEGSPRSGPLRIKLRDSFYGDLPAACYGIEKTNINDLFQLDHAAWLHEALYPVASRRRSVRDVTMSEAVEIYRREVRQAVFDRMSVAFLVSDRFESDPGWPVAARGDWHGKPFVIQRNPTALPRAYVVPKAVLAARGEPSAPGYYRELDARESVFMSDDPLCEVPSAVRQPFTRAEWASTDSDHPVLQVTTSAPGLLVVSDSWMPGWTARVDGASAAIGRGNHAQRVIPLLQAGRHTITLDYRPPFFTVGCVITGASALVWVMTCVVITYARVKATLLVKLAARRYKEERSCAIAGSA